MALAGVFVFGLTAVAAAQVGSASGRVGRLSGTDTLPVAGTWVVLHRIATGTQGPIDSTLTDARGQFSFRFRPDTGTIYLVSTTHQGIAYFSAPLLAKSDRADTGVTVVVSDTSSEAPVAVAARHLVITIPGTDGVRNVFDLTTLRNTGSRTRIAPDTVRPSWSGRLPAGTEGLDVGQGDFSPQAVTRRGDSVLVFAPIAPGEKQLVVDYHVALGRQTVRFTFDQDVPVVNLLLEDPRASITGFARATRDTQVVEGRTFRRWNGAVSSGDTIHVRFPGEARSKERAILIGLVCLIGLLLIAATWRYRALAAVLCIVAIPLAGTGCRSSPERSAPIRVVDDAGDTTALSAPAARIVSLVPAVTELLFAIGAGDAVVGRTMWCDYPPAAAAVANVGDGINPNIEAILARRPDLVVLYRSTQHDAVVARLRALGVAAVQLHTDALRDVGRVARTLGRLAGRERAADSLAAAFDTALRAATSTDSSARPKVLLLVWDQPPMTVGTGSFLSEIVERAGGQNLFADIAATSATISIEAVAARDPDLVLLATEGPTAFTARPEWQVVRAIREGRFVRIAGSQFSHPGPRSPAAVVELAQRVREARR